jgi:hypothetical protein
MPNADKNVQNISLFRRAIHVAVGILSDNTNKRIKKTNNSLIELQADVLSLSD